MAFDLEEQEKIASIKAWWNKFGNLISWIIILVMSGILGNYAYQWYQRDQAKSALVYYDVIDEIALSNRAYSPEEGARIEEAAKILQDDYASTVYADRGVLLAASYLANNQQNQKAQALNEWLMTNVKQYPLAYPIARLNQVAILTNQAQYDQALALLENPPKDYVELYLDRKGDILQIQGKPEQAVQAWQESLKGANLNDAFVRAVELKINTLGGQ